VEVEVGATAVRSHTSRQPHLVVLLGPGPHLHYFTFRCSCLSLPVPVLVPIQIQWHPPSLRLPPRCGTPVPSFAAACDINPTLDNFFEISLHSHTVPVLFTRPYHAMPCHAMPDQPIPYRTIPYHIISLNLFVSLSRTNPSSSLHFYSVRHSSPALFFLSFLYEGSLWTTIALLGLVTDPSFSFLGTSNSPSERSSRLISKARETIPFLLHILITPAHQAIQLSARRLSNSPSNSTPFIDTTIVTSSMALALALALR
jgi:hypothetical protein